MGKFVLGLMGVLAAFALVGLLAPPVADAAFITVNTTADEYNTGASCSLREAIEAAYTDGVFGGCSAADENDDTILLTPGATYLRTRTGSDDTNSLGDFDVADEGGGTEQLTITGNGATIQGTGTTAGDRLFDARGDFLFLDGMTLRDGNTADRGGALRENNSSGLIGLSKVTITANHALSHGGGVEVFGGTVVFQNTTVSGNSSDRDGGGIDVDQGGSALFNNATVAQNTADADATGTAGSGGGVSAFDGIGQLNNTIVASNSDLTSPVAPDCWEGSGAGSVFSVGYSLIGTTLNCSMVANTGDIRDVNAMLAPLASNGGLTQTQGLYPTSPAVNAGDPGAVGTHCLTTDQRNVSRPVDGRCDMGAFEGTVPLPPVLPSPPADNPTPASGPVPTLTAKKCKKKKAHKGAVTAKKKCKKRK